MEKADATNQATSTKAEGEKIPNPQTQKEKEPKLGPDPNNNVNTIVSITRDETKYVITITDGFNTWKLRWPRKKLEQFRDKIATAPKIVPRFTRAKDFTVTDWVFSEQALQDYDKLMGLFYGPQ